MARKFFDQHLISAVVFGDIYADSVASIAQRHTDLIHGKAIPFVGVDRTNFFPTESLLDISVAEPVKLRNSEVVANNGP
jgi:hypothetical protein